MKKYSILFLLLAAALALFFVYVGPAKTGSSRQSGVGLEEGFVHPPASAKPHTWWHWMNGNISREGITADLEAMADAGIGGAQIFNAAEGIPHGAIQFNSPEWIDMVKHAALEAKRLGLELCIHNCAGWSSSGGPWNTPEHSMKTVVTSEIQVKGPARVSSLPPQPKTNLNFYRDIAVLAFPTPAVDPDKPAIQRLNAKLFLHRSMLNYEEPKELPAEMLVPEDAVIDLTDKLLASGGQTVAWEAPAGDWTVLRVGYTSNGRKNHPAPDEGTGLEVDKLSREAVKAHWDGHLGLILAALGKTDGPDKPGFNNVLIDSYEVGTQNWTQGFEKEFQARCGYSIIKFLPVFTGRVVGSPEITERFMWDLRRVVADLFAENYSEYFGELAHKAGLLYSLEPYGDSPSDDIQYGSYCDIPMGEFWPSPGHSVNIGNSKLPSSVAHVYGKKIVGAEAFTAAPDAGKWLKGPFDIKAQGDAAYCGGINRMIYHRYAHQPWTDPVRYPGMTMGQWGTHFERTLTWWQQGKDWLRYQARCQYMLQEGNFVADVLFYSGEDAPNELRNSSLDYGYDYDGCDTRALEMLRVKDGLLTLPSGMQYRMLVLPDSPAMSPEVLKTIGKLTEKGAVVVGKTKPEHAVGLRGYPASDAEVKRLADKVWQKVITGKSPSDVLRSLGVKPDFNADADAKLNYIHRQTDGMDWYFVACPSQTGVEVECTFRVSGKTPEFWYPETGKIETAPVYEEKDGLTAIPIRFAPSGSVFVVFRKPASADHAVKVKYTAAPTPKYIGDLKIVKAAYGYFADDALNGYFNVTDIVRNAVAGGKLNIFAGNGEMGGDPMFGTIKQLRIDYRINGTRKREQAEENQSVKLPQGAEIISAYYGVVKNVPEIEPKPNTVDVTAKLNQMVKEGELTATANDGLAGGKTLSGSRKELRVEYLYDGVRRWAKAGENRILSLPPEPEDVVKLPEYELRATASGAPEILVWKTGSFELTMASGKTWKTETVKAPEPVDITGAWQLTFPPNWGAPEQVTLDKLISWTQHPEDGVKYFSGTATYTKTFVWDATPAPDTRVMLDLGKLKNFAEVELNGKPFPVLWKPPYYLDVTDAVREGENLLQVKITNMWPNRLIGDEQLPDDREWNGIQLKETPQWVIEGQPSPTGRFTFTTWHHWRKDDDLLPSGLLGPVCLRTLKSVKTMQ
ncbi:MAG: hypothetical protein LBR08_10895 [Bacteroidales bacterium]|jgi:hypothetical protein|nr:hypothetical protein [Bacteroidales bacterium]